MICPDSMYHGTHAGDRKGSWVYCFGFWYFFKTGNSKSYRNIFQARRFGHIDGLFTL